MFLAVGRMVRKKGFDHLLTACSLLQARTAVPFRCRLVGDGELLQHFRDRVRDEGLDEFVELPGRSPVTAMTDHYSSASAMVVPSVITADGDRDGIPNVALEAMSFGLPIIASEVSGLPEVVNEGKNGFLVPPGESDALADAMLKMLELDDLSPLGAESRRIIIESFNVETNVRTFLATAESFLTDG
jgi:glycosyltransferase involved in cell wall biosynthesis